MDRRSFLLKGASLLGGYLLGLSGFSQVLAFEKQTTSYSQIPSIALIIDDIGGSLSLARIFLKLKIPLTFSILPQLRYTDILAAEINHYGHEIMLHQPMEPNDPKIDPGPGALYVGDDTDKITRIIEDNISGLSLATGINNHMGSRFTESHNEMSEALRIIKDSGLFLSTVVHHCIRRHIRLQKQCICLRHTGIFFWIISLSNQLSFYNSAN